MKGVFFWITGPLGMEQNHRIKLEQRDEDGIPLRSDLERDLRSLRLTLRRVTVNLPGVSRTFEHICSKGEHKDEPPKNPLHPFAICWRRFSFCFLQCQSTVEPSDTLRALQLQVMRKCGKHNSLPFRHRDQRADRA